MDAFIQFLIDNGYWGMFISAFIAGSFLPFSSEAVMIGLLAAKLDPWALVFWGTAGNWAGTMLNYFVGRMGKMEWIEKYLHVKKPTLQKAQRFLKGRGAWMGFFAFLPILGTAIAVALGLMRANLTITAISSALGKVLRYLLIFFGTSFFL
ncbi:MAG: DedA family protein [Prevotella sp.]|uniref:YqaA family protein n=1 Tax=Prevotella sp. Rep29 TaxID=2691580 RepID=UPI001C6E9BAD|nr:VTT domain-containing protein [Prevotella sp. Rep29]MBR1655402.1 DedA family protein [Prevotella sp.]MBR3444513.1 DedA family protein [Prevotella sp.]QYR11126.1 DedA family protein [Prevotella sp. Rep29]